ncbi:hypothetical protein SAMN03159496_03671 [Rhizobium sp. NFR07]|uniref:hypothetical protein n=1 Tax=Rhizobium sp. NFR07 TaxID=1566262 RepID=UPI0008F2C03F|nr:hypothetical protein [Rhizobium sp. NFR07]SFB43159.1 hypothetical protein SAMN03159496_03671 [Rhizobium sp. NFR07]
MSIDLTERSYERPPAAGKPRSVPYLKLVHSAERSQTADEQEEGGRNIPFALVIGATAIAIIGLAALWLT